MRSFLATLVAGAFLCACGGPNQPPPPDISPAEQELDRHSQALVNVADLPSARNETVLHRDNMGRVLANFRAEGAWMGSGGGCPCGDPQAMQTMMDGTVTIDADVQKHHDIIQNANELDEVRAECQRYHQEVSSRVSDVRSSVNRMGAGCGGMMRGGGMMGW
ncbi:MAG: hypothetical protein HY897_10855 [Deltaproteobacteria bacterium]|nr:hypothetical protein [Deltaproteobacteria bacterium]